MTFDGFVPPTKNYFPMPNNWIDICAEITNLSELKVIQYVLRHTWGYREYGIKKVITTDEFMYGRKRVDGTRIDKGTGLSNRSVIDGLRAAEKHGFLESHLDDTDQARKSKSYALKMQPDVKNVHSDTDNPDVKNTHIRGEEPSHQPEEPSHQPEEPSHRSEKDTGEKHSEKDTGEKQGESPAPSSPLSKEEVFQVYDTYMGFVTVRSRDNLEGAELLSKAGKTAQQIVAALEAIENDPDHFDWNRISLKVLSDRIDARQKRVRRKRTQADYGKPPPQQQQQHVQVAPETARGKPGDPLATTGETSPPSSPPQTAQEIVASIAERVNAAGRKEHTRHV